MTDKFIIVASGPSARGFIPPKWATTICVNQAIDFVPRCNHWFTLDPSAANLKTMNDKRDGVKYWCAVEKDLVKNNIKKIPDHVNLLTRVRQTHNKPMQKYSPMYNIHRLQARFGLDKRKGYISTGNSAWGALNLAYHLGAKKVMLVGVDANDEPKLDGQKCRTDMNHLPLLFESARDQIDMVSCGAMKANGIPKMTIESGLQWLAQ